MGKLLSMKDPITGRRDRVDLSDRLTPHVVAACSRKMSRRCNQPLSKTFIGSLKTVTTWKFDENKRGQPKKEETENDLQFVIKFFLPVPMMAVWFPNLTRQAKLVKAGTDTRLYTKESCLEFHQMLLYAIDEFVKAIKGAAGARPPNSPCTPEFKKKVMRAVVCGYVVQRLAKGAALQMHLKTIGPLLRCQLPTSASMQGDPEERDEDFDAVQASFKNGNPPVTT